MVILYGALLIKLNCVASKLTTNIQIGSGRVYIQVKNVKCPRCKYLRMMWFVDGFGERRVYCRLCGANFLETSINKLEDQKDLVEFNTELRIPPGEGL